MRAEEGDAELNELTARLTILREQRNDDDGLHLMEGGREAFQYRQSIYQAHWGGPVDRGRPEESRPEPGCDLRGGPRSRIPVRRPRDPLSAESRAVKPSARRPRLPAQYHEIDAGLSLRGPRASVRSRAASQRHWLRRHAGRAAGGSNIQVPADAVFPMPGRSPVALIPRPRNDPD